VRIEHVYRPELTLDLAKMKRLEINAADTPTHAELAAILEGKPNLTHLSEIDLARVGRNYRLQTIAFKIARDVFEQMQPQWSGSRESLLGQVIGLVERAVRSNRIVVVPELFAQDDLKRRIVLTLNMNRIVQHVFEAIRFANTSRLEPVFDTQRPLMGTADMRPWYTSRPCETTRKSHVNVAVYDSTWEASESFVLDRSNLVDAWVKNEHLGFEILYVFRGIVRKYRPDYLIRLANSVMLVLEVKGQETDESRAKHEFLAEWAQALNAHGGFGRWAWDVSRNTAEIEGLLNKHASGPRSDP
jgi:type III restriction enzyme